MKNRAFNAQEKRVSKLVSNMILESRLRDIWVDNRAFTWNRANSDCFSTIDRILYNPACLVAKNVKVTWSMSCSDHAAVHVSFDLARIAPKTRSKITRLDPSLVQDPELKAKIDEGVSQMFGEVPREWDPHMKLEFLKVCIRSVVEKVQADRKRIEKSKEELLNEELDTAVTKLSYEENLDNSNGHLLLYIEELRAKKSLIVEERGQRLAERFGSKWYNEGEKSTRYFMRLLNRANPDKFVKIENSEGELIIDEKQVEEEIVKFYKNKIVYRLS